jgi:HK97 family phage major capsid protein
MNQLVERRKQYDLKKERLSMAFKQMGQERDYDKVTVFDGDRETKISQIVSMSEELKKEESELKTLAAIDVIEQQNRDRYAFHMPADASIKMPDSKPGHDFKGSFGEFVLKVSQNDPELKAMGIISGEAGGFMVPSNLWNDILKIPPMQSIVRPRARVIPPGDMPDAEIDIPALRQGPLGLFGGVTFTAANEGTAGTSNDPKLDLITLVPQRLSGYITVGNSLLRNVQSSSAFIESVFRDAKAGYEDYQFIQGAGGAYPLGMLNAAAAIAVSRGTASTIVWNDVLNMMIKFLSPGGVWIASQTALGQIMQLKDSVGNALFVSSGNAGAQNAVGSTLLGKPIFFTFNQPVLGTKGDLLLVDPAYYLIKDGSGPFIQASEHVNFTSDQTIIKMTWWYDGEPWVKNALLMPDASSTTSPFVVLS